MKRTIFFFIFILAAIMAQAQSRRISGQIVDQDSKGTNDADHRTAASH